MKKRLDYAVSLDLGTNSIGWAVTDTENNLLKHKGRNMWGVRLFEEGKTAVERRTFRSTRRRLNRRRQRIKLLQELVGSEVYKFDESFFMKLNESFLINQERKHFYNFFNDNSYTDIDYYKSFPTIYHLRSHLIHSNSKIDFRLVYLAIHHIIKYRGNFLYEGQDFIVNDTNINHNIKVLFDYLVNFLEYNIDYSEEQINDLSNLICDNNIRKKDKIRFVDNFRTDGEGKKALRNVFNAIMGYKFNLAQLCRLDTGSDDSDLKISLSDEYNEDMIATILDEHYDLFLVIKSIYSSLILRDIVGNHKYLSDSMVLRYDEFKNDLKILKRLMRNHFSDKYKEVFRLKNEKINNYYNFMNSPSKTTQEDFYKYLKSIFNLKKTILERDQDYQYCIQRIENEEFLLKQKTKMNSLIPYQLHKLELVKIIENQGQYYPILVENFERLVSLLEFRIPYYVGPLNYNPKNNEFAWAVRKQKKQRVLPWNFKEVIDINKSAEKFITRMTNKCTYLLEEDVLPKHSLLISEFDLLDELNKISINNKLIPLELKNDIIENLFKNQKTIKENTFIKYLKKNPLYNSDNLIINGYRKDKEFASSLTSYIDFKNIFGKIDETNFEMIEEIIKWITLFEDKNILKDKILESYPDINAEQLSRILKLNYRGWSRLSRKLIDGITSVDDISTSSTIIDIMRKTNLNFMQIINSDKYQFASKIDYLQKKDKIEKLSIADIQELPGSPALKKAVWQAVQIVDEIIRIMKYEPTNIFLEVTRSDQKSERTTSRIDRLLKLYDKLKEESDIYNKNVHDQLKNEKRRYDKLDNDRLLLYFLQNGKCMYSDRTLEISQLHLYDIDHIIPQSLIKDDSIDNRVLVYKMDNQIKGSNLVLSANVINNRKEFWTKLFNTGLMSPKKYYNLLRREFKEEDIKRFINRQLVETSQIIKNVAVLLNNAYQQSDIITIKSSLVNNLRNQLKLYKNRNINDFHHAHDAYLAACIGNFINLRYPRLSVDYIYGQYLNLSKNSTKYRSGLLINSFMQDYIDDQGELIWDSDAQKSKIRKALDYKDYFITKKLEEQTGTFYKQTIYPKGIGRIPIRRELNPEYYGGYTGIEMAYYTIVSYNKGKKTVKEIVGIPIMYAKRFKEDENQLTSYLQETLQSCDIKILKSRVLKNQLFEYEGSLLYLTSPLEANNAKQLFLNKTFNEVIYKITNNTLDKNYENDKLLDDLFLYFTNKLTNHYPIFATVASRLNDSFNDFKELEYEDKCKFILQILNITQANAQNAYLKSFEIGNLRDRLDRIRKSFDVNQMIFIDQSITGMYEKRYRL